eukprot:CAMPEP_0194287768 /NCGR_PEP_ID=MMETSP0169-20130528/35458_1 /TAXON_ID=218684 /ORGANISM="Corethron pennatum, Strain L29A3" /LENGTH=44 /DNA_ID= /DNA_START= /DNA_END= /DNA_ORIENTATION=
MAPRQERPDEEQGIQNLQRKNLLTGANEPPPYGSAAAESGGPAD